MSGKIVMVTGATSGIGLATVEGLARQGAHVILVARNPGKAEQVLAGLRASLPAETGASFDVLHADLSLLADVRALAAEFYARYDRLDVLVNNAGAMFPRRRVTGEGIEMTWALDYLSPFLLTHLLLGRLEAAAAPGAPARVVNVSSAMQARGKLAFDDLQGARHYSGMAAYAQAKLALIMFTYELARRVQAESVTVNALHPGLVASNIYANAGRMAKLVGLVMPLFSLTPAQGAETSIYLASSPEVQGVTGEYFDKKRPVRSSQASYNVDAARRLWELSEELTGLRVAV